MLTYSLNQKVLQYTKNAVISKVIVGNKFIRHEISRI